MNGYSTLGVFFVQSPPTEISLSGRGKLGVVRLQPGCLVDRQPALAVATAEEMRRHHDHRNRYRHAFIDCRQQNRLSAATGTAGDNDALRVHFRPCREKIRRTDAAPRLQRERLGMVVTPTKVLRVAESDHVV
jgi:hypothetical protein